MNADPVHVTPENWALDPWPEGLAVFVQCKTPGHPGVGHELPCLPANLEVWAMERKIRVARGSISGKAKLRRCAFCQGVLKNMQIVIQARLTEFQGEEGLRHEIKWLHRYIKECRSRGEKA